MDRRAERLGSICTAALVGVQAQPVTVEASFTQGLPGITIVGMPDKAVNEAGHRVRQALRASGFEVPRANILVNLAPSDLPKSGSGFDLPIAIAILNLTGQIPEQAAVGRLCVGELSLDGTVRSVRGMLAYEKLARSKGLGMLSAVAEQSLFEDQGAQHRYIERLLDLVHGVSHAPLPPREHAEGALLDFCELAGCDVAKRALTIAATGRHGLLMIGPPGSGKSMMASRLPTILSPLTSEQRVETALLHSVAGLPCDRILNGQKPFRAPHHSATRAGLMGGGSPLMPGEVSLAHNGVLFLDEMPEFGSAVLQMLRQPIESGFVALARARGTTTLQASFLLVAASNPCPCGFSGDPEHSCTCSDAEIRRYRARIGGPLLDRFDLVLDVWRSPPGEVLATGSGTSSATMRAQVAAAQAFALKRKEAAAAKTRAEQEGAALLKGLEDEGAKGAGALLLASCELGRVERARLEEAAMRLRLSGRGIMRALSVARTIADIERSERVCEAHILEALNYRAEGRCGDGI